MKIIPKSIVLAAALMGCSGGPGAPIVRTNAADGEGTLIAGCSNVSQADKTNTYIVGSYLTTWGSANREGTAAGLMSASKDSESMKQLVDGFLPSSETFCRSYPASARAIIRIVKQVLPKLGYKITYESESGSVVETDFVFKKRPPINQWKDRYIITFEDSGQNETIVRVFRDVYISRCFKAKGGCSEYIRATSVGHNEAWILNYVDKQI